MDNFISNEVLDGLERAKERSIRQNNRLSVHMGDTVHSIRQMWDDGFAVKAQPAPNLRGFVSVFDGSKMLYQCLIVCSAQEGSEVHYEFKRQTDAEQQPAVDFVRNDASPIALLG